MTREYLQRRYPPGNGAFTTNYSSLKMADDAFVTEPRHYSEQARNLLFVGSLAQMYKAPEVLLEAVSISKQQGVDFKLRMIGDGRYRQELENLSAEMGLGESVEFLGEVNWEGVLENLDKSDIFVLPSRTEGLPRAMIEAMARGLVCVGSDAGGIPELISSQCVSEKGNSQSLADTLMQVATNVEQLNKLSAQNLESAQYYRQDKLTKRREDFYSAVLGS